MSAIIFNIGGTAKEYQGFDGKTINGSVIYKEFGQESLDVVRLEVHMF